MSYVLITGVNSDIVKATSSEYAKNGYDICVAARNSSVIDKIEPLLYKVASR